jgi:uncharacterized membrane protein YgdD (TMEM256/DUF423 family)
MSKLANGLTAYSGLMGACGIAAAAAAAHAAGAEKLNSVALILLVHAGALLALINRASRDARLSTGYRASRDARLSTGYRASRDARLSTGYERAGRFWLAAALVMAFGATLFSLDVTLLTLRGAHLFPMAAPTGGISLILAWLLVFFVGLAQLGSRTLR